MAQAISINACESCKLMFGKALPKGAHFGMKFGKREMQSTWEDTITRTKIQIHASEVFKWIVDGDLEGYSS